MLLLEAIKALSSAGQLNHTPPLINVYSESSCALPNLRSFHLVVIEVAPWLWAFHLCCSKTSSTEGGKKKQQPQVNTATPDTSVSMTMLSAQPAAANRLGSSCFLRTLMFRKQAFACLANDYDCNTVPPLHEWPLSLAKETSRFA